MGNKVIICLNPFSSHFYPTLALARQLQNSQYEIAYLGFREMESVVNSESYRFLPLYSCSGLGLGKLNRYTTQKQLAELYKKVHEEIKGILDKEHPQYVFVGVSRFLLYFLPAYESGAVVVLYSLCAGPPGFSMRYPPNTAYHISRRGHLAGLVNLFYWIRRFARVELRDCSPVSRLYYPWPQLRRIRKREGCKWRYGIDGYYLSWPVVVFGPRRLVNIVQRNTYFLGLCVREDINKVAGMWPDSAFFKDDSRPLIYCSLGTLSSRYSKTVVFFKALVDLLRNTPQWRLLISLGATGKSLAFGAIPDNVRIVDFAPQKEILKKCDLMITHGGYGSIKECINYAVPMVVFPSSYDQQGNAALVHSCEIGVKGKLLKKSIWERITRKSGTGKITPQRIQYCIEQALYNPSYKKNIQRMRELIIQDNEIANISLLLKAGAVQNKEIISNYTRGVVNMDLMRDTYYLLKAIKNSKPRDFSGIGLVAYDSGEFDSNCHCDLRPSSPIRKLRLCDAELCDYLIDIANYHHPFHDGFLMINERGELTQVAQYFVPPVIQGLEPNQDHGVRLHSSICGSTMKGVLFIAVISSNLEINIFSMGKYVDLLELEDRKYECQ